jgi:hypothetical protein
MSTVPTDDEMPDVLRAAPAILTVEELTRLEELIEQQREYDTYTRRLALAVLTKPGRELLEDVERDDRFAEALAVVDRSLDNYVGRVEELLGLLRNAQARNIILLAMREDMYELLAQAEKPEVLHA